MTADYIKETGNHVLYRATPVFDGDNLVADGVLLEGILLRITAPAYVLMCSAIMSSRELKLTTLQGTARRQIKNEYKKTAIRWMTVLYLAGAVGFEPTTFGFGDQRSTS